MAGGGPLSIWNEWATQILVLLSLTLQVVLLFSGIRRRQSSAALTFLLWLVYLLADSTAIYALGHISLGGAPSKHQLVAFWAPFLLIHLSGPDNITAYSLEDSKLWLRHLQNLVVQVLGVAYVLYKYVAGGDLYIMLAAVSMFSVGVVKYGERTWALMRSNLDSIRRSLQQHTGFYDHFHPPDYGSTVLKAIEGDEFYVRCAHSMFHICKRAIVDSWVLSTDDEDDPEKKQQSSWSWEEDQSMGILLDLEKEVNSYKGLGMWTLMEMELSLMYDLLYTKAGMIHTWPGYGIRVASSLAAAASFLLFHLSSKVGHDRVDLAVSYTLLSEALLLETSSLLRVLGSTWTYALLCDTRWSWLRYAVLCTGRWDRLRWLVKASYIAFLLVDRPYMLPGLAHSMLYRQTCDNLADIRNHNPYRRKRDVWTKLKGFFRLHDEPSLMHVDDLADILSEEEPPLSHTVPRLYFSLHGGTNQFVPPCKDAWRD